MSNSNNRLTNMIKQVGTHLAADGKNLEDYLYKLRIILKENDLYSSMELKFQVEGEEDAETKNMLESRHYWKKAVTITADSLEDHLPDPPRGGQNQAAKNRRTVHSLIALTTATELSFIFKEKPEHPGIALASIGKYFQPAAEVHSHALFTTIYEAKLEDYGNNYARMAASMVEAQRRLRDQGVTISDQNMVYALLKATPNTDSFASIKTVIRTQQDLKFHDITKLITSEMESKGLNQTKIADKTDALDGAAALLMPTAVKANDLDLLASVYPLLTQGGKKKFNNSIPFSTRKLIAQRVQQRKTRTFLKRKRDQQSKPTGVKNSKKSYKCQICRMDNHDLANCGFNAKSPAFKARLKKRADVSTDNIGSNRRRRFNRSAFTTVIPLDPRDPDNPPTDPRLNHDHDNQGAFCTAGKVFDNPHSIYLDSGATANFFNDRSYFSTIYKLKKPRTFKTGDNTTFKVFEAGLVNIISKNSKGREIKLAIHGLLATSAPASFISSAVLDDNGYALQQENGIINIFNNNGIEVAHATRTGNLFAINARIIMPKSTKVLLHASHMLDKFHSINIIVDPYIMHKALGHASARKVYNTIKCTHGLKPKTRVPSRFDCAACDLSKSKRPAVRKHIPEHLQRRNPYRVHSDVKTAKRSKRGYTGWVIFTIEGSRHTTAYPIKKKSDVNALTQQYFTERRREDPNAPWELRSDRGGEYMSTELRQWLLSQAIDWTPPPARTPEGNSFAERHIQTLWNMTLTSLTQSGLGDSYWCYALQSSAYVFNRTVHRAHNQKFTPHYVETGSVPDLSNVVPFGCIGVAPLEKNLRPAGGLGYKAEYVRMLAYDKRWGSYLVYSPMRGVRTTRVSKWYPGLFKFPSVQLKKTRLKASFRKAVVHSDEPVDVTPHFVGTPTLSTSSSPSRDISSNSSSTPTSSTPQTLSTPPSQPAPQDSAAPPQSATLPEPSVEQYESRTPAQAQPRRSTRAKAHAQRHGFIPWSSISYMHEIVHQSLPTHTESLYATASMSVHDIERLPRNFRQAVTGDEASKWIPSMRDEVGSLVSNHTWDYECVPSHTPLISTKWVYKKKIENDGSIRYKSRLVARGYNQSKGINYFDSYAPTLSLNSLRSLLAVAARFKYTVHNLDITTAYLYGSIDCPVHLSIPEGLDTQHAPKPKPGEKLALRLNKSIYGLVQSGHIWHRTFKAFLQRAGFKPLVSDNCVYRHAKKNIIVGVYVDDVVILYKSTADLKWLIKKISEKFKFKNMGKLKTILGLEVHQYPSGNITICQKSYIERMAEKFGITPNEKRAHTPLVQSHDLYDFETDEPVSSSEYRSVVGAIMYVATGTRPDISHSISKLARFSIDPRAMHMKAALRLIKYLLNTKNYTISYGGDIGMVNYTDAGWNTTPNSRSIGGYFTTYANGPVTWRSFKIKHPCCSTAESEYVALSELARETISQRNIFYELGYPEKKPTPCHCDSSAAKAIAEKPGFSQRSKSIRLAYHNVRYCVNEERSIQVLKIKGTENPADIFTKTLPRGPHQRHCKFLFTNTHDDDDFNPKRRKTVRLNV